MPTETSQVYHCGNENRRQTVRATTGPDALPALNGIDYLEVSELGQSVLDITFIHPLPGETNGVPAAQPALAATHFKITGGERITGIRVLSVTTTGNRVRLTTDTAGDFSTYTLHLAAAPSVDEPPPGFDPRLARIDFSFKAACPSPFDCRSQVACESREPDSPRVDYLARDYQSYRRILLDRLRLLLPDYMETSAADFPIALTELLAYVGDQFAYAQDANATEAYLGTARHRISVKRHARLRDYWMHEGCNARTWVHCTVEPAGAADGRILEPGTGFFLGTADDLALARKGDFSAMNPDRSLVFEAMEAVKLRAAHNRFEFYTWSDTECALCEGAQSATLRRPVGAALEPGMVLVFEELRDPGAPVDSTSGGRPEWRWPVRLTGVEATLDILTGDPLYEVTWAEADALPFSFVLSRRIDDLLVENITVALGNIVLADHGLSRADTAEDPALLPAQAPLDGAPYRPCLKQFGLSHAQPLPESTTRPAAECLRQDPTRATASLRLSADGELWHAVGDLLGTDGTSAEFVVEIDNQRRPHLRFGTGGNGRAPAPGQSFSSYFRIGNGTQGNIGADTLRAVIQNPNGIIRVRNPLPARGGTDPESIEQVKQFAPVAFRTQQRAVTLEDYENRAAAYPGVQKAKAEFRWLASWYTVMLAVDRIGGQPIDDAFRSGLVAHMERYRMMGYDLDVRDPVYVPLEIVLELCLRPDANRTQVHRELQSRLGSGVNGLFHPDRLSFGQRIYLSRIIAVAIQIPGVQHASMVRFKRFHQPAATELEDGYLEVTGLELPRLANNPSFPERGTIEFILQGGSQ